MTRGVFVWLRGSSAPDCARVSIQRRVIAAAVHMIPTDIDCTHYIHVGLNLNYLPFIWISRCEATPANLIDVNTSIACTSRVRAHRARARRFFFSPIAIWIFRVAAAIFCVWLLVEVLCWSSRPRFIINEQLLYDIVWQNHLKSYRLTGTMRRNGNFFVFGANPSRASVSIDWRIFRFVVVVVSNPCD